MKDFHDQNEKLQAIKDECWTEIESGLFWRYIMEHDISMDFYQQTMCQIYHYILHTPKSQALAAVMCPSSEHKLARFGYHHAYEEVGHEHMIMTDLVNAGIEIGSEIPYSVYPETEAFIGYVYYVSLMRGAKDRLGLSYWIEGSYENIAPLIERLKETLNLTDSQLSFFVEHAQLDAGHFNAVKNAISKHCVSDEDIDGVTSVLKTSLTMFGRLLDGVAKKYLEENKNG